jgi:probable phosphoglycerate mutase
VKAELTQHVFLVRHGETEWSDSGKHTGRTDVPLSEEGRRMAGLVGNALAGRRFAKVLCSPLSRAMETCAIAGFGAQAEVRDTLVEWDYGVYEGLTTDEIRRADPNWSVWTSPIQGGESVDDVGRRCDGIIEELKDVTGDAVLFAHGHVLRILGARWIGLPAVGGRLLALATAAISILGYEREQAVLELWNSDAHLHDGKQLPGDD